MNGIYPIRTETTGTVVSTPCSAHTHFALDTLLNQILPLHYFATVLYLIEGEDAAMAASIGSAIVPEQPLAEGTQVHSPLGFTAPRRAVLFAGSPRFLSAEEISRGRHGVVSPADRLR